MYKSKQSSHVVMMKIRSEVIHTNLKGGRGMNTGEYGFEIRLDGLNVKNWGKIYKPKSVLCSSFTNVGLEVNNQTFLILLFTSLYQQNAKENDYNKAKNIQ